MSDNKREQERAELYRTIWALVNELGGSVDGWDYKQYVLGMLLYRYISEKFTTYLNKLVCVWDDGWFRFLPWCDIRCAHWGSPRFPAVSMSMPDTYGSGHKYRCIHLQKVSPAWHPPAADISMSDFCSQDTGKIPACWHEGFCSKKQFLLLIRRLSFFRQ